MMKKFTFLLIVLAFFFAGNLRAQYSVSLNGEVLGDTVTFHNDPATEEVIFDGIVTNNSDDTDTILITRRRIHQEENTSHYFCWGACFAPNNADSLFRPGEDYYIVLGPGESTDEFEFAAHYFPNGVIGVSMFEYTFYNKNDSDENVSVVAVFDTRTDGITDQIMDKGFISDLYPNPATSYVTINYDLPAEVTSADVRIVNILGSVVKDEQMNRNASGMRMDISDLTNGVYFYSIIINGEVYKTKKLIVK